MPAQNNGKDNFGGLESPYFSGEFFAEYESEEKFQPYPGIASESPFQSLLQADLYESPSYEEELDEFEYEDEEYEDECGCDNESEYFPEDEHNERIDYNDELDSSFQEESEINDESVNHDPLLAIPLASFTEQQKRTLGPLLTPEKSKLAIKHNSASHPKKSGINPEDIIRILKNYVDFHAIRYAIDQYNRKIPNNPINIGLGLINAEFVEAIHQFQIKCYKDIKEHDGEAGASVLDSLGFWPRKGMLSKAQTNDWARTQIRNKSKEIDEVLRQLPIDLANGVSSKKWWSSFVNPSFLGWRFNRPIHIYFARKLRKAEEWLLRQPAFSKKIPVELAKYFDINEKHAGGRPTAGSRSIHTLGLGFDIKYIGNPHVGDYSHKSDGAKYFSDVMKDVFREKLGKKPAWNKFPEYLSELGNVNDGSTSKAYDDLFQLDQKFREYLKLPRTKEKLEALKQGVFKGRTIERDPQNGFLNLDKDLVVALRDHACLVWGAIDFGDNANGDIMHFDCRIDSIGRAVYGDSRGYFNKRHPCWRHFGEIGKEIKIKEILEYPSMQEIRVSSNSISYLGGKLWVFKSSSMSTGVAIFCSQSVLLKPEVDVLLYAHGLLIDGCRPKRIPSGFVTDLPFNFGNIVTDSGRPVVLVIPYLNWKSPEGKSAFGEGREKWHKLGHPKNLNALIAEVLVEVGRIQSIATPSLHNLIIAGHSRAYDFLEPLAYSRDDPQMQQGALAKLSQVWAFDTTYSGNVNNWLDWLSINRRLAIKIFYRSYGRKKDKETGRAIKIILGTKKIGDAFYKHRNDRLTVLPVDEGHCSVPSTRLPELLRLSTIDKEREVDEAFWESYESEQDFNFEYELSGGNSNLLSFDQSPYISESDKDFEWTDEELLYDDYFETRRENLNSYEDSLVEDNLEFEDCACEALVENGLEFEDSPYELDIPEINQLFGGEEESYESEIHAEQDVYQQETVNRYNQKPPAGLIRFFQLVLNVAEGENLAKDGNLGQITHAAIKRFRKKYDLGEENIVDEKVQIALVQRALEVIKQQSIFPRFGQWDDKTEQSVIDFKAKYGLGFNKIIDSATRDALVAALGQRKGYPDRSSVVAPKIRNTIIPEASAYRNFRLTTYHVVEQKNFPTGTNRIPIYDDNKHIIAEGSPEFFANLSLEGTALLDDGRLVNVTGKMVSVSHDDYAAVLSYHRRAYVKKPETSSRYSGIEVSNDRVVKAFAFHVVPEERRGVGYGILRKIPLVPFRTLAADIGVKRRHDKNWKGKGGLVPIGTRVYIKEYDGLQLPDNTIHDGWFTVNDTGGGIFGAHFDVFVGTQSLRKQVKLPSIGHVWFSGIEHRITPNYSYGL